MNDRLGTAFALSKHPTIHDQPFINPENLPYPDIGSRYKGNVPSARALVLKLAYDTGRVNLVQSHILGLP